MSSWSLALLLAAACVGAATALFFWKKRHDEDVVRDILRLAAEIDCVASTVDVDLAGPADEAPFVVLRQRSREARERATEALTQDKALRQQEHEALIKTLLLLHDDHRRIVDLRSEVDRALARRARTGGDDRCRIISMGRSKPSLWPSSSLLTRPSTFS